MIVPVFMLGRPGSGKSTAAHHLTEVAWDQGLSARRMGDYAILYRMFKSDTNQRFRPTYPYDGFDVIDSRVLDEALEVLRQQVNERVARVGKDDPQLLIVEFSRASYRHAL